MKETLFLHPCFLYCYAYKPKYHYSLLFTKLYMFPNVLRRWIHMSNHVVKQGQIQNIHTAIVTVMTKFK